MFLRLDTLLRRGRVRTLYIGGLAVRTLGRRRATRDIDLVPFLRRGRIRSFLGLARENGFAMERKITAERVAQHGYAKLRSRGVRIELFLNLLAGPWRKSAWMRKHRVNIFGRLANVPSREDQILLKAIPDRPVDRRDIRGLVDTAKSALDSAYMRRWVHRFGTHARGAPWLKRRGII